jgi:YNFM family putative membrane transporter
VTNPCTRSRDEPPATRRSKFGMEFIAILSHAWARIVLFTAFVEGMLGFGVFGFVSADLHSRFGLGFTIIGLTIGAFSLGGIVYALTATFLVARLGQIGLSVTAAVCLSFTYVVLAVQTQWWLAPAAVAAMGFGFYMLHNTLVANATQVLPRARGSAMALFGASFFFGQTAGAAIFAFAFDRYGGPVIFLTAAILLPAAITWFAVNSKRKAASSQCQS